jgi:hypothetical protein
VNTQNTQRSKIKSNADPIDNNQFSLFSKEKEKQDPTKLINPLEIRYLTLSLNASKKH